MKQKEINEVRIKKEWYDRLPSVSVSLKSLIYFCGFIGFLIFIWYIIEYKHLYVYLNDTKNKYESMLFSIMVSMTLLMFMLGCGFTVSYSKAWLKISTVILIIVIIYYGFYNYGLGIEFRTNFGLLYQHRYESNSKYGLTFFIFNFLFWSFVYVVSLMFMRET
jgi:hypothetical protein